MAAVLFNVYESYDKPFYLRYCDDFIILSSDQHHLRCLTDKISIFLANHLQLELHPKKVILRKLRKDIDFVGYVFFSHHRLVRTKTKQRMKKRLKKTFQQIFIADMELCAMDRQLQSYFKGFVTCQSIHVISNPKKLILGTVTRHKLNPNVR